MVMRGAFGADIMCTGSRRMRFMIFPESLSMDEIH